MRSVTALRNVLLASLCSLSVGAEFPVDLRHTFFSRRDSWIALHPTDQPATLRYVFSRMLEEKGPWLDLGFLVEGNLRPAAITATASHVQVSAGGSGAPRAQVYLTGRFDAVIEAWGMDVSLTGVKAGLDLGRPPSGSVAQFPLTAEGWTLNVQVLQGHAERAGLAWRLKAEKGRLRVALRMHQGAANPSMPRLEPDPTADMAAITRDWEAFRAKMPAVPAERMVMAEGAWWNLWSLYAPPDTNFPTRAVLVAKADMNAVWPWDHCFPALALGRTDLDAGLEQFLLPFLNADERGQLPDETAPDVMYRGVTKPPIHGWALMKLMDWHPFSRAQLEQVYPKLVKWTEFWFKHRDANHNGIPEYAGEHSGWESGWDNASGLGDKKAAYESPDLQAYLVLQMKALARVARELGRPTEAEDWDRRAEGHLKLLMTQFWNGQHFVVRRVGQATVDPEPTSLLNLMPLVLGEHLDKAVFHALAKELEGRFLTPFGLATEDPMSPHYRSDGYWRGPIWAPTTYLLADGLRRGGRPDLSRLIARRFCDMVARAGGHYENYDSLSGQGLRCRGFAWTSAVDLLLMHEYLQGPSASK
ncbi:amylo-alpha-1,6-glucosidase [Geothrix sp. PMB-07]|uniref:amylo-alpha-1,6-glucosidase n=1 Tax=Geothrix sp. PMB-07 TaxID=3068640 RepID=UPI0027419326|nr:trehalase family glycosidase [Geothrix sp. PMB-07]WLT31611.1 trehalase family glycosidase [Geothrix sp. PMB-07]